MLHNLGFWHEHARFDRDMFVEVTWENIIPDFKRNFFKNQHVDAFSDTSLDLPNCDTTGNATEFDDCDRGIPGDTLGLPYDYASIMHYGKTL